MKANCNIRAGTIQDAGAISALITNLAEEFIVNEFKPEGKTHFLGEITPEKMRERSLGEYRFLLAEVNNELAGVATVRGVSHLYYLFVVKRHQRQGIARHLWFAVRELCKQSGHHGPITVNSSTYAVPVYERLGFARTGPKEEKYGVVHHPMVFTPTLSD